MVAVVINSRADEARKAFGRKAARSMTAPWCSHISFCFMHGVSWCGDKILKAIKRERSGKVVVESAYVIVSYGASHRPPTVLALVE